MDKTPLDEFTVVSNTGWSGRVERGQSLRVRGWSIVDFVVFNADDLTERFDQARTKTNQNTLFVTTGHHLYSKSNTAMMSIVADTFEGTHDLQKGMCSRSTHELAFKRGLMADTFLREFTWDELPDHGCWENLTRALASYEVRAEDIPSPLNLFQHMAIDSASGHMTNSKLRPTGPDGDHVTFRAEIDCVVAVSACPDITLGGQDIHLAIS